MLTKGKKLGLIVAVVVIVIAVYATLVLPAQFAGKETARQFDLVITKRSLNLNPPILKVRAGDDVTLRITSDEKGKFHVHGYDLKVELKPKETSTLSFKADQSGSFRLEFHIDQGGRELEVEIGVLEVSPRAG